MNNEGIVPPVNFYGMRIIRSTVLPLPPAPRMQLSPGLMVSDEFRASFDHWLTEFFGYTDPVHCIKMGDELYVSDRVYKAIKEKYSKSALDPAFRAWSL